MTTAGAAADAARGVWIVIAVVVAAAAVEIAFLLYYLNFSCYSSLAWYYPLLVYTL